MSKSEFAVGIDVGKDEVHVSVSDQTVRPFANTRKGLRSLVRWAHMNNSAGQTIRYCMEATGVYSVFCAHYLREFDRCACMSVVNPAQISAYRKARLSRSKTDRIDANVIRSFAETQELNDWQESPTVFLHLQQLVGQRDALNADLRRWQNRRHAQEFLPECDKTVRQIQRRMERTLNAEAAKLDTAIDKLCRSDPTLQTDIALLSSIPGIAERSAMNILAYGRRALTEYDRKGVVAQAGLAPGENQSGKSKPRARLAKAGDSRLRTALYMPTLVAIVHNPVIKKHYNHLLDKGKPKMVALVACMKKLLLIIQAMLKKQQTFNPKYA